MAAVVVVVFGLPVADDDLGVGEGPEQVDVEALIADAGVEGFHVAVALGLTGWDEGQSGSFAGPVGHRLTGQFRAVVAAQHGRVTPVGREPVELVDEVVAGDGAGDQPAEAFAGVLVDDGGDLDR